MNRLCTIAAALFLLTPVGLAQERDYGALARQIVATADISPGDAVGVFGGQHTVGLMEAVAIEAARRGGRPMMMMTSDRYERAFWTEVDEQHLTQRDVFRDIVGNLDVYIGLPGVQDPGLYDEVPQERFAAMQQAQAGFADELNRSRLRGVFVSYPSEAGAARVGMDFREMERMHWEALATDYGAVSATAEQVARRLRGAERVRVTTPGGTDFTFSIGDRTVFLDDGRITAEERESGLVIQRVVGLPGGEVYVAPQETSAEGRVVIPRDMCRGTPLRDVSFRFERGEMQGFTAAEGGDCFEEIMAPYEGPKHRFGTFGIGLNPARRVVEAGAAEYRPSDAAGMVWFGVGDNEFYGGSNRQTGYFTFPLTNATVEADGEVIVRDGRLVVGG
jgi:aminopeptidase